MDGILEWRKLVGDTNAAVQFGIQGNAVGKWAVESYQKRFDVAQELLPIQESALKVNAEGLLARRWLDTKSFESNTRWGEALGNLLDDYEANLSISPGFRAGVSSTTYTPDPASTPSADANKVVDCIRSELNEDILGVTPSRTLLSLESLEVKSFSSHKRRAAGAISRCVAIYAERKKMALFFPYEGWMLNCPTPSFGAIANRWFDLWMKYWLPEPHQCNVRKWMVYVNNE